MFCHREKDNGRDMEEISLCIQAPPDFRIAARLEICHSVIPHRNIVVVWVKLAVII